MSYDVTSILTRFLKVTKELRVQDESGRDGFCREFQTLRLESEKRIRDLELERCDGRSILNIRKNRYNDILPYDNNRVKLELSEHRSTDYINASFIKGINNEREYIATQGPLPDTAADFWSMIWKYHVKVVIMACKLVEQGKIKCARYWPNGVNETENYGDASITLLTDEWKVEKNIRVRHLEVRMEGVTGSRYVYQFQYVAWPDRGTPSEVAPLVDMIDDVRRIQPEKSPPIVVHCSAGCGRTGTICVLDYVWSLIEKRKITDDFSISNIILKMRTDRFAMVQTVIQYAFLFQCVVQLFKNYIQKMKKIKYENFDIHSIPYDQSKIEELYDNAPNLIKDIAKYNEYVDETDCGALGSLEAAVTVQPPSDTSQYQISRDSRTDADSVPPHDACVNSTVDPESSARRREQAQAQQHAFIAKPGVSPRLAARHGAAARQYVNVVPVNQTLTLRVDVSDEQTAPDTAAHQSNPAAADPPAHRPALARPIAIKEPTDAVKKRPPHMVPVHASNKQPAVVMGNDATDPCRQADPVSGHGMVPSQVSSVQGDVNGNHPSNGTKDPILKTGAKKKGGFFKKLNIMRKRKKNGVEV